MNTYIETFAVSFVLLIFLRFVEDSPVRSWKTVVIVAVLLGGSAGWYFNHAFPPHAAPVKQTLKVDAYRQELQRDFRHIDGVNEASIDGPDIWINFAEDKPLDKLKEVAIRCGSTAAYFFQNGRTNNQVTIHVTVNHQDRYEMDFDTKGGVKRERVF